ncbi:hypothetical protein [Streptomyces sp. NPDC057280]|uniref:hypothetical protein n=1 Tax=Streptomyces sp. NPDC057280 TaxID=3346081 RepID=UPI003625400A
MTTRQIVSDRVASLFPLEEPEPPTGCDVCGALARQRTEARAAGDLSRVSDLNVEIRSHHGRGRTS